MAAADVHQRSKLGEIVRLDHRLRPQRSLVCHHGIKAGGNGCMRLQVIEERGPVRTVERRFARGDAVHQVAPGLPLRLLTIKDSPGPKGAGHIVLKWHREGRQLEAARPGLREHAFAGEEAHQAIERLRVSTDRSGKLVDAHRPVFQQVGHAESCGNMKGLGQPIADDEAAQIGRWRLIAGVHGSLPVRPPRMSSLGLLADQSRILSNLSPPGTSARVLICGRSSRQRWGTAEECTHIGRATLAALAEPCRIDRPSTA
jgi:hypothetical protein